MTLRRLYMTAGICLVALLVLVTASRSAESRDGIWRDVDEAQIQPAGERLIVPLRYRTVALDRPAMRAILALAPHETSPNAQVVETVLTLPLPEGGYGRFQILEAPIMAPELAARYPEIKTYRGQGLDDPTATVRFDTTPAGFHAMILSASGTIYIDPYSRGEQDRYISYFTRDYPRPKGLDFECAFDQVNPWTELAERPQEPLEVSSGAQLRTYRTAVAATGEYTQFHGGTKADGQAAIVTAMNRVNGIYEREVAIRMMLVANNDEVVYTNANTDPYSNNNIVAMLDQNQQTLDQVIGNANYDIGHVFGTSGGGIACLGVTCDRRDKACGATGLSQPIGDVFWVDFVSHELGHQWGANHTFNGNSGSCSGGRNSRTAYEPGSGSTIMSYAGICGSQDLQNNADDYFHTISFDEIVEFSTNGDGATCAAVSATGNQAPSVDAGTAQTIPLDTPFTLCGSATDTDPLTYSWEQFDRGQAGHPDQPVGNAPIFRSFPAVTDPCRTFPQLADLLTNTHTLGELLPTYARTLTFRLTARDNLSDGGGVDYDVTNLQVTDAAGPFLVTAPNTAVSWTGGAAELVTWNVANTDAFPLDCAETDILLSTNGGLTFPTLLAAGVPNDGSQTVTAPDVDTSSARVKVQCSTEIFFDLSNVDFSIVPGTPCLSDNAILTDQTVTSIELFRSATSITAGPNFVVASGGSATFRTGSLIVLRDGFSVASSGTFLAEITPGTCQ